MWMLDPTKKMDRDPARADEVVLSFDPDCLDSKFGFCDGDLFSDDLDVDPQGDLPHWVGHRLIERIARESWPEADIWFVETCHNPVRCDNITGLSAVDITMGQVVRALDRVLNDGDVKYRHTSARACVGFPVACNEPEGWAWARVEGL